jgi:hypothetical protein
VCFALVSLLAIDVAAQDQAIDLGAEPAPAGDRGLWVQDAAVRGDGFWRASLLVDWAREPLVLVNQRQELDRVVEAQLWAHAAVSYSLAHRLLMALDVPSALAVAGGPAPQDPSPPRPAGPALGDVRVALRARIIGHPSAAVQGAAAAALALPTGSESAYASDGSLRGNSSFIAGGESERWR